METVVDKVELKTRKGKKEYKYGKYKFYIYIL